MNAYNFYIVSSNGYVLPHVVRAEDFNSAKDEFLEFWEERKVKQVVVNTEDFAWSTDNLTHSVLNGEKINATSYIYSTLKLKNGLMLDCEHLSASESRALAKKMCDGCMLSASEQDVFECVLDLYRVKYKRLPIALSDWSIYTAYATAVELVRQKVDSREVFCYSAFADMYGDDNVLNVSCARNSAVVKSMLLRYRGLLVSTSNFETFKGRALEHKDLADLFK